MGEIAVIEGNPIWKPKVAPACFTIPEVKFRLVYGDEPVSSLRKLPELWKKFDRNFWELLASRLEARMTAMNQTLDTLIQVWAKELPTLAPANQQPMVEACNKVLQEKINKAFSEMERDVEECCGKAYEKTMKDVKGDQKHGRFKAVAKAAGVIAMKLTATALHPPMAAKEIFSVVVERGKSLKGAYTALVNEWGSMRTAAAAVLLDIPAVRIAMMELQTAQKQFGGTGDKVKAFLDKVSIPAKKLQADVNELDKQILLARDNIQKQTALLATMKEECNKSVTAGADAPVDKALVAIGKCEAARAKCASELEFARSVKGDADKVLADVAAAKMPNFELLHAAVTKITATKSLVEDLGKETETIFDAIKHLL